jgi:hypothetical protein
MQEEEDIQDQSPQVAAIDEEEEVLITIETTESEIEKDNIDGLLTDQIDADNILDRDKDANAIDLKLLI